MLDDRRLLNDMARVASGAAGAFGGIKSRIEGDLRDHAERFLARMNLVTREEFDVIAAMASAARMEQERLAERVIALEASLAALQANPVSTRSASAAASAKPPRRRRAES